LWEAQEDEGVRDMPIDESELASLMEESHLAPVMGFDQEPVVNMCTDGIEKLNLLSWIIKNGVLSDYT
jgi:hypothetical protein